MPEYLFKNKETGEEWLEWMGISERTKFLEDNPRVEQLVHGCPPKASDPMRVMGTTVSKPNNGFRDVLREVKKKHPRGDYVNTFVLSLFLLGGNFAWIYLHLV